MTQPKQQETLLIAISERDFLRETCRTLHMRNGRPTMVNLRSTKRIAIDDEVDPYLI